MRFTQEQIKAITSYILAESKTKTSILAGFAKFRVLLLLLSKIGFILAGLYYCYNFKAYSITIHIPLSWRVGIIGNIMSTIESFGLLIMIIPLSIVIISFLITESKIIKILSAFFAVGGNIFTLMQLASSGLFEERFKAGFITIYNTISQDKKEKAFQLLFDEKLSLYNSKVANLADYQDYVQRIISTNWLTYLHNLKSLTIDQVERYASNIVASIVNSYYAHLEAVNSHNSPGLWSFIYTNWFKIGSVVALGSALAYIAYGIYCKKMQEIGQIAKDTALEMKDISITQATIATQAQEGNALIINNSTSIQQSQQNIQDVIDTIKTIDIRLQGYGTQINVQGASIIELKRDIDALTTNLNNYSPNNDTHNLLTQLVQTNMDTNVIQRELVSRLEVVKKDCTVAIDQLNVRISTIEAIPRQSLSVSSPVMRNPNSNIDIELVSNAATIREYQTAMDKIRSFNVKDIVTDVKDDLMKVINTNHAENVTQINDIASVVNANKQASTQARNIARDTNVKVSGLEQSQIKSEENLKSTIETLSTLSESQIRHNTEITNLQSSQSISEEQMGLAVEAIKRVTIAQKEVTTHIEQQNNRLNGHEQKINNQDYILADQEEYIHSSVQEMDSKVTKLHNEIDVTNSKLTSLGESIDTLRDNHIALRNHINSRLTEFSTQFTEVKTYITNAITMIRGIHKDNSKINQESTQVSTTGDKPHLSTETLSNENNNNSIVPDPEVRKRIVEFVLGNNNNNTNTMLLQAEFESNKEKLRQEYLSDNEIRKTAMFLSEKNNTTVEHEEEHLRTTRESILFSDYVE